MMQDKSQDKQATWDFVERRISDVMQVGSFVNQNQTFVTTVASGVQSIIQGVFVPPKANDQDILNRQKEESL